MSDERRHVRAYVSVGSNIEPARHLRAALAAMESGFGALSVSSVYQTRAVGFDGDDFLNIVVSFATDLPPSEVADKLNTIETAAGRSREGERFGPRTLDLDLLMFGDFVVDEPGLKLPRADVIDYAFVLGPLAEIAPNLKHPLTGVTMSELWAGFDQAQQPITRLPDPL